jgi:amino acid transporter
MLYFFRKVYSEVVTALPQNGGSYNALLNTTTKKFASLAACLSLISYVATGVVSAYDAVEYIIILWPGLDYRLGTIVVLAIFAGLTLLGVKDSANVAVAMFFLHVAALTILLVWSFVFACQDGWSLFRENMKTDFPNILSPKRNIVAEGGWMAAIFFGYCCGLLGITGFETAANYVEEMRDGKTYVQTLRNMWIAAAVYNPLISLMAIASMPMASIYQYQSNLLSQMAFVIQGKELQTFICVDAAIVLAGGVLTSYVGVTGLVRRMALDRCFPSVLLATNKWRGSNHWIIISFFALTSGLFLVSSGNPDEAMTNLGNVYALAFLSVMSAFAVSCLILKFKRPDLPRLVITSHATTFTALAFVVAGLVGTVVKGPEVLPNFFLFFGAVLLVVFTMLSRTNLLRLLLKALQSILADKTERDRFRAQQRALVAAHTRTEETSKSRGGAGEAYELLLAEENVADEAEDTDGVSSYQAPSTVAGTADTADAAASGVAIAPLPSTATADASSSETELTAGGGKGYCVSGREPRRAKSGGNGFDDYVALDDDDEDVDGARVGASAAFGSGHSPRPLGWRKRALAGVRKWVRSINSNPVVYFAKTGDLSTINKAILYVRDNEQTSRLCIVHVVDDRDAVAKVRQMAGTAATPPAFPQRSASKAQRQIEKAEPESVPLLNEEESEHSAIQAAWSSASSILRSGTAVDSAAALQALSHLPPLPSSARCIVDNVKLLDAVYPKLRIDCLIVRGSYFSPAIVKFLAGYLGVTPNMMFMAMPDAAFPHQFAALGGVRVITRAWASGQRELFESHSRAVLSQVAKDIVQQEKRERGDRGSAHPVAAALGDDGVRNRGL